ncbi:diacylglycerol kinase family protein [Candidatus Uhrbacteria bacterium]|nr:diacylglycerol kinase family protein [Candidatus Uhrbacteria bacterium]
MINFPKFVRSVRHALHGVAIVFRGEQNFRIQCFVGVLAFIFSFLLELSRAERIVILLLIPSVLVLELINSTLERIADTFKSRIHPIVGELKDIMAGAVLIASVAAAIIGLNIFLPRLWGLFVSG